MLDNHIEKISIECHEEIHDALLSHVLEQVQIKDTIGVSVSNSGGWHSKYHTLTSDSLPQLNQLFEEISRKAIPMLDPLKPRENILGRNLVFQYWFNINYRNDSNGTHNHIKETEYDDFVPVLSGVYYLKTPKNSGTIVFPSNLYFLKPFYENTLDREYDVTEGEGLIFYPHLDHFVQPNLSDDYRVSLAFNLHFDHT